MLILWEDKNYRLIYEKHYKSNLNDKSANRFCDNKFCEKA